MELRPIETRYNGYRFRSRQGKALGDPGKPV